MQNRLEKARNDIHRNVSNSRSRSASHNSATRISSSNNVPINITRQTHASAATQKHYQTHVNDTSVNTHHTGGTVTKCIALQDLGKTFSEPSHATNPTRAHASQLTSHHASI